MNAFELAVRTLLRDRNVSQPATYVPASGPAQEIRVLLRRPDVVTEFGSARVVSASAVAQIMISDVSNPQPGDEVIVGSESFVVQGEPVRDRQRLVWTVDLRPA